MGKIVKVYSMASEGNNKVSDHFRVREFACKDGSDMVIIAPELVELLEKIRSHFGAAITINSSFRTASHNKAVGGEKNSQHLYGCAADIVVKNVSPEAVYKYAEMINKNGGVGKYKTFTHVDVRGTAARWKG